MKVNMNMCGIDRSLRIALSLLLIYIGFFNTTLLGNPIINVLLGLFGLLNLISAMVGFCPVYHMAQLSTYREKTSDQN